MTNSWLVRLVPSHFQLLAYLIIAPVLLLVGSYSDWINQVVDSGVREDLLSDLSNRTKDLVATLIDGSGTTAFIASFVFWLVVGSIVYMLAWIVIGFIKDVLSEITVSLVFVHPRSFTESRHWSGFLVHYLLRVAVFLVVIGYSALAVYVLWPAILTQFSYGILAMSVSSILKSSLPALLLLILIMHIFVLLLELLLWRRSVDYWAKIKKSS